MVGTLENNLDNHKLDAAASGAAGYVMGAGDCRRHPSPQLIAAYVAGQLACPEAIAVAAHLAMCPDCAAVYQAVAGHAADDMLTEEPALDAPSVTRCLVRAKLQAYQAEQMARLDLPASVAPLFKKYIKLGARWWRVFPGVQRLALKIRSPHKHNYETSLLRIKAGTSFPQHAHDDVEYMVVLQGTMVDERGTHHTGAFLTTRSGEEHTPRATPDADVLCLNVARGGVRFTSGWLRLLNPLLKGH